MFFLLSHKVFNLPCFTYTFVFPLVFSQALHKFGDQQIMWIIELFHKEI
jgi:hypothetical protein